MGLVLEDTEATSSSMEIYRMLLEHNSVYRYDLDYNSMKIDVLQQLPAEARSGIDKIVLANRQHLGIELSPSEIFSWIARPTNTYLSLLQFVLVKSQDSIKLLDWLGESDDLEIQYAVKSILYNCKIDHYNSTFTAYRALLLSIEHGIGLDVLVARLRTGEASEEGLRHAITLVAAYLQ